ncbi:MAG: hypothetical protein HY819_16720 [Acidobacteria bacterium]|nr:hypothetical protein [Acidobacteriota bacterium]
MSFKLQIKFFGLCAFVPNTKLDKSMRVFLIDARAPGVASSGVHHVSHVPAIKFSLADLVLSENQPFFLIQSNSENSSSRGQWTFNGDDLEIRVNGKVLPQDSLKVLDTKDKKNFYLVPSTKNIYPEIGGLAVKEECFLEEETLNTVGIAARLQLTTGSIGTNPTEYISTDEYYFAPSPSTNKHKQKIASCTMYEVEIDSNEVEIFSKRTKQSLVFSPQNGEKLELSISNIPPEGLEAVKMDDPENTIDFELAYLIAKQYPSIPRIPARSAIGPEYPKPLLCASIIYNPDPNA